jgi:hypothetical protein
MLIIGAALLASAIAVLAVAESSLMADSDLGRLAMRVCAGTDAALGLGFLFFGLRKAGEG